jgi:hypothetical protein
MSLELLEKLNGDRSGSLHRWIDALHSDPRIAWYPSAGNDFRDLLFLHTQLHHEQEPAVPDLFLHTDYWMSPDWDFSVGRVLHDDGRTSVIIAEVQDLPRQDLPLDPRLVDFPEARAWTGRVLFMRLLVNSTKLGTFERLVLYAFVENAAFIGLIARPARAVFSHLIHVRYGVAFGGSKSAGGWLQHTLTTLGCEVFISDGCTDMRPADTAIRNSYPEIWRPVPTLHRARKVASRSWSDNGDVNWLVLGRDRPPAVEEGANRVMAHSI